MKKYYSSVFTLAAMLAIVMSCAREEEAVTESTENSSRAITICASIDELTTKVSFSPSYDATYGKPESMSLAWAYGDQLRVYNHADRTQYSDFTLDTGSIGGQVQNPVLRIERKCVPLHERVKVYICQ